MDNLWYWWWWNFRCGEISEYLKVRFPDIPDQGYENTLAQIDLNKDGRIEKKEMFEYIKILMNMYSSRKYERSWAKLYP